MSSLAPPYVEVQELFKFDTYDLNSIPGAPLTIRTSNVQSMMCSWLYQNMLYCYEITLLWCNMLEKPTEQVLLAVFKFIYVAWVKYVNYTKKQQVSVFSFSLFIYMLDLIAL